MLADIWTAASARRLRALPLWTANPDQASFVSTFRQVSRQSRRSLISACQQDPVLANMYQTARFHFSDVANPETGQWDRTRLNVVAQHHADIAPIASVLSVVEGQRFCLTTRGDLQTFVEFEVAYGRSVREVMESTIENRLRRLEAARCMARGERPRLYHATLGTHGDQVASIEFAAFSQTDAERFARRQSAAVLDLEDYPANFDPEKGGYYATNVNIP